MVDTDNNLWLFKCRLCDDAGTRLQPHVAAISCQKPIRTSHRLSLGKYCSRHTRIEVDSNYSFQRERQNFDHHRTETPKVTAKTLLQLIMSARQPTYTRFNACSSFCSRLTTKLYNHAYSGHTPRL